MFARARGLSRWCTLYFKFDGDATLYVRVFREDGRRAGCYPEDDDRDRLPSPTLTRMKMATGVQAAVLGVH